MNKGNSRIIKGIIAITLLFFSDAVFAADGNSNGWYILADMGYSSSDSSCNAISDAGGFTYLACDDASGSYDIGAGYRMQHLGIEGKYGSLGKFTSTNSTTGNSGEIKFNAATLTVMGYLNAGRKEWDGFIRGGLSLWRGEQTISGPGAVSTSDDGASFTVGLGGLYTFNNFSLVLSWDLFNDLSAETAGKKVDIGTLSLGGRFNF